MSGLDVFLPSRFALKLGVAAGTHLLPERFGERRRAARAPT